MKVAFLDRDGVINKKAEDHHYITSKKALVFNQGIFEICSDLKEKGFAFIIITNQRGIARGLYTENDLEEIHQYMRSEFRKKGIDVLDILYCPHEEETCECRKPKPGMLLSAVRVHDIELSDSILISDSKEDIKMGEEFGIGINILIRSDHPEDYFQKEKKIRIAFIKYAGLTTGGSEKLLQIIAANLPRDKFEVTYFYTDMVETIGARTQLLPTSKERIEYLQNSDVRIVKLSLSKVNLTSPTHPWENTNIWELFNEKDFDIVQTCRAGHKEFPFTHIRDTPLVDIIALSSGCDNQYNISRVLHLCEWSKAKWTERGGDALRVEIVSLPIAIPDIDSRDMRSDVGVEGKFTYGFHQRKSDVIFSPFPLKAYSMIESDSTAFILMGGSDLYKKQAAELNLKNVHFIDPTGDSATIMRFLKTLNVYAHGRKDGEINSQAIAEAMYFGLPIVSHVSEVNNGHIECIGNAGRVLKTVAQYSSELELLKLDPQYYGYRQREAYQRFKDSYELNEQMKRYVAIYEDIMVNPYPNKTRRFFTSLHYTQNVRLVAVYLYLQWKYFFRK